jgi:hypothetical protein
MLELPGDLTPYEKRVEVGEAKKALMNRFSLDKAQIEGLLLKLRQRSKAAASSG